MDKNLEDHETMIGENDSHRLNECIYCAGAAQRKYVSVSLSRSVTVYGLKHPSQGFSYRKYQARLADIMKEIGI